MNPVLLNQLRSVEPEIARAYSQFCDSLEAIHISPSDGRQLADDVDNLVKEMLGALKPKAD